MAKKRVGNAGFRKKFGHLRQIHVSGKFLRIPIASLPDLMNKVQSVGDHIGELNSTPAASKTLLGRAGANRIVSACARSTDFNVTVQFCGLTGAGMQRCVVGKLQASGYDPDPLNLNIQDNNTLDSVAATIQWAAQ